MYKEIVSPALDRIGHSEEMHIAAREVLHLAESNGLTLKIVERISNQGPRFTDERLKVVLGGLEFGVELDNPVIVGAGWDKPIRAAKALYAMGFSGIEGGSVLARPQNGNEKPRQFIVGPGVSINWLGYNTPRRGMDDVEKNLRRYEGSKIPIGVNVGKNTVLEEGESIPEAYAKVVERFYRQAAWFTLGFSPNTKDLAQSVADTILLTDIIQRVYAVMDSNNGRKPLYVKIGPDLPYASVDDIIKVVKYTEATGIEAVNSTTNQDIKARYGPRWGIERGGLTGDNEDYRKMASETVRHIYKVSGGGIEIIGIGGVKDANTALEKIQAGATAVQVVTAIRGEGPGVAGRINRGLVDYMEKEGIENISELVGIAA